MIGSARAAGYVPRFSIALLVLAAVLIWPATAISSLPRLARVSYEDPLLSRVTILWRCDPVSGGNVVYRGYMDAAPHGTAETVVGGLIWLADSGLIGKGKTVTSRQTDGRFSAAVDVPRGPEGTFNLMPFRILFNGSKCGSPVSIYWLPIDEADLPSIARSNDRRFSIDRAHEFALR